MINNRFNVVYHLLYLGLFLFYNIKNQIMEEEKIVCPKCGNEENFHFNYDYSKIELPIIDILCNECGEFFELKNSKQK